MGRMKPIDKTKTELVATKITQEYISPIPSSQEMNGYGMVDPSFPDRIMRDFEANSETVRELQRKGQQAEIDRDTYGQVIFLILGVLTLAVIAYAIYAKAEWVINGGAVTVVSTMAYKAIVYYTDRKYPKK